MSARVSDNPVVAHAQDFERQPSGGGTAVVNAPDGAQGAIDKVDPTEEVCDLSGGAAQPRQGLAQGKHVAPPAAGGPDASGDDWPSTAETQSTAANAVSRVEEQLLTGGSVRRGTFHGGNCGTELAPVRARQETRTFRLDDIKLDVQVRNPDEKVVGQYRVRMDEGDVFALVEVMVVRSEDVGIDAVFVTDGGHRLAAMRLRGVVETECLVEYGDLRTAKLKAAGANKHHGVRMTNTTKKEAVKVVLSVEYDWTDNRIATHVGVSPTFVANVRKKYDKEKGIADDPARTRLSSSGRTIKPRAAKPGNVITATADRSDSYAVLETATETTSTLRGSDAPVEGYPGQPHVPEVDTDTGVAEYAADQQVPRDDPPTDKKVVGTEPVGVPVEVFGAVADAAATAGGDEKAPGVTSNIFATPGESPVETAATATTIRHGAAEVAGQSDAEHGVGPLELIEKAGKQLWRVQYTRHGIAAEELIDLDDANQGLPAELSPLRSLIGNISRLCKIGISRAALVALVRHVTRTEEVGRSACPPSLHSRTATAAAGVSAAED